MNAATSRAEKVSGICLFNNYMVVTSGKTITLYYLESSLDLDKLQEFPSKVGEINQI